MKIDIPNLVYFEPIYYELYIQLVLKIYHSLLMIYDTYRSKFQVRDSNNIYDKHINHLNIYALSY